MPKSLIQAGQPMHSSAPVAYLNGRFLPQSEMHLPLHDAGFVFGATITDLCRTFHHRLFRLADHLERFQTGCRMAQVPQPLGADELTRLAEHLVAHNAALLPAEAELALVLFATPGPIGYYAGREGGPGDGPPTLGMHSFPIPFARYALLFREGAHLVIPGTRHIPSSCLDPRIKQRSRLHWWLAEQEAHQTDPRASALLLDAGGHVTETAAANLLLVRDGVVLSPPRDAILDGISLRMVEEICAELGIRFAERPLTVDDCLTASEAFLSNTAYCLAGVSRINDFTLPWPGPVYLRVLGEWGRRVGVDICAQIVTAT
jgi:branched-subunit amino acid aminotransferase/4-amino-4-deoxychorismate lyase